MNRNLVYGLILSLLIISIIIPDLNSLTEEQLQSWTAPRPQEQLDREGKRDLVGLGRVFLPAMTSSDYEPFYTIISKADGNEIAAKMGESVHLRPGDYIVYYGSGTENQMMNREVSVAREITHIVEPDWAGLRVRLIDENRNSLDAQYELFNMQNAESYGYGLGVLEEYGEQVQTWLLRPGRVKVVLNNKPFNTLDDFATVDLAVGELRVLTIVINSETNNLIGAGVLEKLEGGRERRNLRYSSAIHGNFSFNMDNSTDRNRQAINLMITTQLDNRVSYDIFPYYYTMRNLTDLGVSKDRDSDLSITTDSFKLRNTFVYYLSKIIGLYGRLDMETHFFPEKDNFSERKNVRIIDSDGNLIRERYDVDNQQTKPSIYPLVFREGIGFNVRPLNRPRSTLNLRLGFGMRQDIYSDVYRFVQTDTLGYQVYQAIDSSYKEGTEISILGNFHTPFNISYNTTADILIPFDSSESNSYTWENVFSIRLIRQLALDYKINFSYNKDIKDYTEISHNIFLRLTYFLY